MAFDSLTEKLQNVFKNLRSKGRLTEDDVKENVDFYKHKQKYFLESRRMMVEYVKLSLHKENTIEQVLKEHNMSDKILQQENAFNHQLKLIESKLESTNRLNTSSPPTTTNNNNEFN